MDDKELVIHLALAYLQKQDTAGLSPREFIDKFNEIHEEIHRAYYGEPGAKIFDAD